MSVPKVERKLLPMLWAVSFANGKYQAPAAVYYRLRSWPAQIPVSVTRRPVSWKSWKAWQSSSDLVLRHTVLREDMR
jgi:hypothetical protein